MNLIIRVSEICWVHLFIFTNPFGFLETRCFLFCCLLSSVSPCECKQHMVAPSQASSTVHTHMCMSDTHTHTLLWWPQSQWFLCDFDKLACKLRAISIMNFRGHFTSLCSYEWIPLAHTPLLFAQCCSELQVGWGRICALQWLLLHGWN